ncbi:MAG: 50S ribosomal protein L6 [Candidatus Paceibacterota bacterium]
MSRIGKKLINIPAGVEIKIDGQHIKAKGAKGELEIELSPLIEVKVADGKAEVGLKGEHKTKKQSEMWGLSRALIANMIKGVSEGFEKGLEFSGVGFKAQVKGKDLELNLGYTNPVIIEAPEGITFQVEKNSITVQGINKEVVGHIAALIRAARPPEPYKGTGVKYKGEVIRRKAGKKAMASA